MPRKTNNDRKFSGGGPRPDHASYKLKECIERQEAWSKLSHQQQLVRLDARLGAGVGAVKQRARIAAAIEAKNRGPAPVVKSTGTPDKATKQKPKHPSN